MHTPGAYITVDIPQRWKYVGTKKDCILLLPSKLQTEEAIWV